MARIRSIRPEFWEDPKIGRLSMSARLTYIGLWNFADDEGRFRWNPRRILGDLFSFDEYIRVPDVEEWLDELIEARRIVRYSVGGEEFAYIPTFKDHQKPQKPTGSKLPEPADGKPYWKPTGKLSERYDSPETAAVMGSNEATVGLPESSDTATGALSSVVVVGEVVGEGVGVGVGRSGRRDDVWDSLVEIWGEPESPNERGKLNKVRKDLVAAGVTGAEVVPIYEAFVECFPDASITPTAVLNHLGRLRKVARGEGIGKPNKKTVDRNVALDEIRRRLETQGDRL